jgi:hypothetical protein
MDLRVSIGEGPLGPLGAPVCVCVCGGGRGAVGGGGWWGGGHTHMIQDLRRKVKRPARREEAV